MSPKAQGKSPRQPITIGDIPEEIMTDPWVYRIK